MAKAEVIKGFLYVNTKTGQKVSPYGAAPWWGEKPPEWELQDAGFTVAYPDGTIGHNCHHGMTKDQAQAVADRYNTHMDNCRQSHEAMIAAKDCFAADLDTIRIDAAKTYRSHWQWMADFPGFEEWTGYEKSKKAALARARKVLLDELWQRAGCPATPAAAMAARNPMIGHNGGPALSLAS